MRDEVPIRVYSPEKTLADCFKYRNKIGIDTVIEALKLYQQRKPVRVDELLRSARVCRVLKIMKPYLERYCDPPEYQRHSGFSSAASF